MKAQRYRFVHLFSILVEQRGGVSKIQCVYEFTSLDEIPAAEFALYPNPTENVLNLNSTEQVDRVIIIDSQGRVVIDIAGIQRDINMSTLLLVYIKWQRAQVSVKALNYS